MKKYLFYIVIAISFLCGPNVLAQEYTMSDKCSERLLCTIKTEPNEKGNYADQKELWYLFPGDVVSPVNDEIIPAEAGNKKCSTYYQKVNHKTYTGYVCADYINKNEDTTYYNELKNAGFPDSYLFALNAIKKIHTNWNFVAVKTNIDWNKLIEKESGVGINYIYAKDPNGEDAKYLSLEGGSYNEDTKTFNQMSPGGYYAPNRQTVAYYLDPRNFLSEGDMFMFESNEYNSNYSDDSLRSAMSTIFGSNDIFKSNINNFLNVKNIMLNPLFAAVRSKQEVTNGNGVTSAADGSRGTYNFYNIGAFDNCENPIYCGAEVAQAKGWTTPESAIIGGAYWIYSNYTTKKQDTVFFQKFNLNNGLEKIGVHQYMTNIKAPKNESDLLYKGYNGASALNNTTTFYIPVYENMPATAVQLPTKVNTEDKNNADSSVTTPKNTLDIASIVNGSGYRYGDTIISNIGESTSVETFKNRLQAMSNDATIIVNSNGKDVVGTGDTVTISNNGYVKTLTIVIYGDIDGNGKVSINDLVSVQTHLLNKSGYTYADDANRDGKYNIDDLVKIQRHLLQTEFINQ